MIVADLAERLFAEALLSLGELGFGFRDFCV